MTIRDIAEKYHAAHGGTDGNADIRALALAVLRSTEGDSYRPERDDLHGGTDEVKRLRAALVGALKTMDVIAYQTSLQSNMSHENWKYVFGLAWEGRTKARESLGETPPVQEHPDTAVCDGVWRCKTCGEMHDPASSAWRWNGDKWQHNHGTYVGYIDANYFGKVAETGSRG